MSTTFSSNSLTPRSRKPFASHSPPSPCSLETELLQTKTSTLNRVLPPCSPEFRISHFVPTQSAVARLKMPDGEESTFDASVDDSSLVSSAFHPPSSFSPEPTLWPFDATQAVEHRKNESIRFGANNSFTMAIAISGHAGQEAFESAKQAIVRAVQHDEARPSWFDLFEHAHATFLAVRKANERLDAIKILALQYFEPIRNEMYPYVPDERALKRANNCRLAYVGLQQRFLKSIRIRELGKLENWKVSCYRTLRLSVKLRRERYQKLRKELRWALQNLHDSFQHPEEDVLIHPFAFLGNLVHFKESGREHPELGFCVVPELVPAALGNRK